MAPALLIPEATDNCTVEGLVFGPAGDIIIAGGVDWLSTSGSDGAIGVWDITKRQRLANLAGGTTGLAIRPDGTQVAATTLGNSICLWDIENHTLAHELIEHEGVVTGIAYNRTGDMLASASEDGALRWWNPDTGESLGGCDLNIPVKHIAFAADGKHLYTANGNNTCFLVEVG
jgi:WD40 repeat protein